MYDYDKQLFILFYSESFIMNLKRLFFYQIILHETWFGHNMSTNPNHQRSFFPISLECSVKTLIISQQQPTCHATKWFCTCQFFLCCEHANHPISFQKRKRWCWRNRYQKSLDIFFSLEISNIVICLSKHNM